MTEFSLILVGGSPPGQGRLLLEAASGGRGFRAENLLGLPAPARAVVESRACGTVSLQRSSLEVMRLFQSVAAGAGP